MMKRHLVRAVPGTVVALVALAIAPGLSGRAIAQETYPDCQPPDAGEYLLLVQGDVDTAATQIQDALPEEVDVTVCNYLDSVITRVGGFTDADTAATWAQYLSDVGGLSAYVARPPEPAPSETPDAPSEEPQDTATPEDTPAETEEPSDAEQPAAESATPEEAPAEDTTSQAAPAEPVTVVAFPAPTMTGEATLVSDVTEPTTAAPETPEVQQPLTPEANPAAASEVTPVFDPKLLGDGYAVLVEYFDQPDIATRLQDTVGQAVGLVSYNQKPYLLVSHTASSEEAGVLLRSLSSQFSTMLVDSSTVVVLSPAIAVIP